MDPCFAFGGMHEVVKNLVLFLQPLRIEISTNSMQNDPLSASSNPQNPFQIHVKTRTLPNTYDPKLVSFLLPGNTTTAVSEMILLQAGPSFFSVAPVLNALKTAPIPLCHQIAKPPTAKNNRASSAFAMKSGIAIARSPMLPQYCENGGTFDLSFLTESRYFSR